MALVHGRMKAQEKQAVMQAFKQGELQLLVATTVIEVGVDVPNASLMIIENPERLGLAQLHQLRGRVGRGAVASHCVLLYKTPLSKTAQTRLQVLRDSNDGFVIAQRDLEIRGGRAAGHPPDRQRRIQGGGSAARPGDDPRSAARRSPSPSALSGTRPGADRTLAAGEGTLLQRIKGRRRRPFIMTSDITPPPGTPAAADTA